MLTILLIALKVMITVLMFIDIKEVLEGREIGIANYIFTSVMLWIFLVVK